MNVKTYRARTMADAFTVVKRELGPAAVVLHTRTVRVGGFLGLWTREAIEVTATDSPGLPAGRQRRPAPETPAPTSAPQAPVQSTARAAAAPPTGPALRAYAAVASPGRSASAGHTDARPAAPAVVVTDADPGPAPEAAAEPRRSATAEVVRMAVRRTGAEPISDRSVEEELRAIRRMVGEAVRASRQTSLRVAALGAGASLDSAGGMPDALGRHYLKLLEAEVAAEVAEEVIGRVRDELTPEELGDESIVRQSVLRALADLIPASGDVPAPARGAGGRPRVIALVGPTGVGKTTTVAKLAAAYKLRHGRRVGLITTDTYRIAAVDQLRTYANIIGLPLRVVVTPADAAAACDALADRDVILIDSAGRSPRDADRLDELRAVLDAARPDETHLVLSGAASERALVDAAERFAPLGPTRVIFTKLDEAVTFGALVSAARRVELKLSYVTTGQEVPDHIEVGRPDRLARLLLDGAGVA